ncbi:MULTISPECIES: D-alanyl-D-alanine carboxypeptidase/D-alanyl-D-alanine-endopeptidase [Actinoplanes]|uniref:D-alanyl-D-alanine carboxypeptidase/D-alanyl-D-alanine endopeptidase n=1 Tax=Actinoplanes TaxID=1865 RepID=UPI0005F2AF47|nr:MULTISPECIES: D-alanyl-D-alanine carboxypeptidase/D-alanyl-D-alanine-endopeptidase [Actinoplanes]GLY06481.1 D-alanyl-D-alanine carboxypeptidase DacC [Actinoplanes sp. NBRC 101535]
MRPASACALLLTAVLAGGSGPPPAPASGRASPSCARGSGRNAGLDRILADPRLAGATVAVEVRDAEQGVTLYARDADRRVLPASNQKLLTAAAAFEVLGPAYRFRTGVATGPAGDLVLTGQGDPTMTPARYDALAAAVAAAGITHVPGGLVADDSWFDRVPYGLDWSWQDEPEAFAAPVSALTFAADPGGDTAAVAVRYAPGARPGRPPRLVTVPPAVALVDAATTGPPGSPDTIRVTRAHGSATVTVTGAVPQRGAAGTRLVAVADPVAVSAGLFRRALLRHGVTVAGRTRVVVPGSDRARRRTVAAQLSAPLAVLVRPMLKRSANGPAELLVKAMGRAGSPGTPGSWPTGLAAARTALGALTVDMSTTTLGDGSGLSRRNWLTVHQLANLLTAARSRPWFPDLLAALPVAGDPDPLVGGTLRSRFRGTPAAGRLRAKTGTLTGVNALSGYLTINPGETLVVAAIVNNATTPVSDILDALVVYLSAEKTFTRACSTSAAVTPPPGRAATTAAASAS